MHQILSLSLTINNLRWPLSEVQLSFTYEYACTSVLRKLTLLGEEKRKGDKAVSLECVCNPSQVRNGGQWSINPMVESIYVCAHVKTPPMGECIHSCSLSSRSAVTIVSASVARSRSVAFHVSTRACSVRLFTVLRAASRDNFAVCIRDYYTRVGANTRLFPMSVSVPSRCILLSAECPVNVRSNRRGQHLFLIHQRSRSEIKKRQ